MDSTTPNSKKNELSSILANDHININDGEMQVEEEINNVEEPKKPITSHENPIVIYIQQSASDRDERVAVNGEVLIDFDAMDCSTVASGVSIIKNDDESIKKSDDLIEISDGEIDIEDTPNNAEIYNPNNAYLNDAVINSYFNLIKNRSPDTVYVFDTFLYSNLVMSGYKSVKRWTKNVDLFSKEKIFIPIHLTDHWILAFIDFRNERKSVRFYDSFLKRSNDSVEKIMFCWKVLLKYFRLEYKTKKGCTCKDAWYFSVKTKIPTQQNSFDCGVFVCVFAEYLSRDALFDFTQNHMLNFRKQIFKDIQNKTLTVLKPLDK